MAETMTEFMSESARISNLIQEQSQVPRRRVSVILSNEGSGVLATEGATSTTNITDSATTRSPNPIPSYSRINTQIIASTDDAWRTIEDALARNARTTDLRNTNAPELRTELRRLRQLTQMRERLRSAREAQPLDPYSLTGMGSVYRRGSSRSPHNPANGVRLAGLAMSQDGRRLYCGTEEGIFEFCINLHARKGFPAITPR